MFKSALRDTGLVLLGMGIAIGITAKAGKSEFTKALEETPRVYLNLGAGQCRYQAQPDGQWMNRDQEHSNRYKTNGCPQFGVTMTLNPAWSVSADWVNLGWARTNAQAVACAGDSCPPKLDPKRAECNKELTGDCLYNFRGAGGVKGLKFAFLWDAYKLGPVTAQLEGGVLAYVIRQSIRVTPLDCTADDKTCSWTREIEQKTRCGSICLSPEVGATLWWKNLGAGFQYYLRTTQHTTMTAGFGGPATVWMLKARIPL
jgi:hypothetical protein